MREAASDYSMPPGFTRDAPAMTTMAPMKTRSYEAYPRFRRTILSEWHVREIRTGQFKAVPHRQAAPVQKRVASPTTKKSALGATASPVYEAGSSSTLVVVPLTLPNFLSILGVVPSKSIVVALSFTTTGGALNRAHRLHPLDKGKAVMVNEIQYELPSNKTKSVVVPLHHKKAHHRCQACFKPMAKKNRTLQWEGVYLSLGDIRMGRVDPTMAPSDTVSIDHFRDQRTNVGDAMLVALGLTSRLGLKPGDKPSM
uniref:Uncharacterized protein n=1 Tax=Oryza punctata TaxID=4537 RepID=A0A0E0LBI7_ORYPU